MHKSKQTVGNYMGALAEDAQALLVATSEMAGEKVTEARKRLAGALERGKEVYGDVRDKALDGVKATDQVVRDNPYPVMAIALGMGAIVGFFLARSWHQNDD